MEEKILTPQGAKKLKEKLEGLRAKRPEIIGKLKFARSLGDLSENAEYASARHEQALVEGQIKEIENILRHAKIVSRGEKEAVGQKVEVGCKVRVESSNSEEEFTIVGATEANPAKKEISCESPLGKALVGRGVGDEVSIVVPVGAIKLKILKVS